MWTLRLAYALLLATPVFPATDTPSADEQAAMIARMRDYAAGYQDAMPNYVCTRVVRHFESGLKHVHWNKEGEEREELSVVDGREHIEIRAAAIRHARLITEGEFIAYLTQVFNPSTEAHFTWSGWDSIHGQRMATFTFSVDVEHSTKSLSNFGVRARLPYQGKVWADPNTGTVFRMRHEADDIPSELHVVKTVTTVDYQPVSIKGNDSILPVLAVTVNETPHRWIKNETEFRDYREFHADSKITFGPPAQP